MTDTPIATPAEQPAAMVYQGQLWSREQAETRRAELMAKPDYVSAAVNGDVGKQTELKDLYMLARGLTPAAPAVSDMAGVGLQQISREEQAAQQHSAVLNKFELSDKQKHEIVYRRPLLQWEKDSIAAMHERAMRDETFRERLHKQERGAMRDQYLANAARVAPLARSQADIDEWNRLNPFKR